MTKFCLALLAVATALAIAPAALADTDTSNFTISGSGISGSGTLTFVTTATPGVDDITGITGSFLTTNDGGFSGVITGLPSGSFDSNNPSSNALSVWDNLLYPAGNSPTLTYAGQTLPGGSLLDGYGLLFDVAGGYTVNLWGNGSGGGYSLSDGSGSSYVDNTAPVNFVLTPEPSSLLLLGTGLLGLAFVAFRKAKPSGLVLHS
jgi:hypothetical protein